MFALWLRVLILLKLPEALLHRVIRSCWRAGFMLVSSALIACSIIGQGRTWFFQAHGQCDPWQHFHVSTLHYAYLIKCIMNSPSVNFYSPASASRIKVSALEACLFAVSFRAALCLWVSWSPCSKSRVLHCMHYCLYVHLIQLKMLKFVSIECVMIFAFALAERKRSIVLLWSWCVQSRSLKNLHICSSFF